MENIEYSGYWWLPLKEDEKIAGKPEKKIAGTLTFTNDEGIKLRLMGSLHNYSSRKEQFINVPIILGVTHEEIITLYDCSTYLDIRRSSRRFSIEECCPKLALIGRHFTNPNEILFHKAEVQYSYLSYWGELPGIKKERDYQDNNKLKELRLTYTVAENIEVTTKDAKISVFYGGREAGKRESIDLKQYVSLIIEPNKELPFQDFNSKFQDFRSKFIGPIQDFITFATDRANSIAELKLYSYYGDADVDIEKIPYTIEQLPIKALYKTNYPDIKEQNRLLFQHEMLFSVSDIDNRSSTLERWFDSRKELDSTFNLFFSIWYKPDMYLNHKFLNLVQVVESYHRRRIETNEEKNSSLQERAESYHCCLIKKKKKKEPFLRERLEALLKFELILDVTNELIQDKDSFITKVVHTRNYLTHYRESLKEKAAKGKYLYCLT
ncbi:MAG: hypothetical protein F6K18_13865 [Okeania sp. SIO2C2]|uniref:ApeA N-terminal domain 1-containing protein n=1 Tax=Okeania sp. SIO2C2 TaxID=2607787 RepID=UPI0013B5C254|nr:HEPN domain-containing protein [Okeania sp. SIO2C2]NEP87815.1 hypothetical protein [Okeania sp. SIO2C2]